MDWEAEQVKGCQAVKGKKGKVKTEQKGKWDFY